MKITRHDFLKGTTGTAGYLGLRAAFPDLAFASAGFGKLFPAAAGKIIDVRLARWGHALCHAKPGWYAERSPLVSRPVGRVLFAHSDNQGLPAFESALLEGIAAAQRARELLKG